MLNGIPFSPLLLLIRTATSFSSSTGEHLFSLALPFARSLGTEPTERNSLNWSISSYVHTYHPTITPSIIRRKQLEHLGHTSYSNSVVPNRARLNDRKRCVNIASTNETVIQSPTEQHGLATGDVSVHQETLTPRTMIIRNAAVLTPVHASSLSATNVCRNA